MGLLVGVGGRVDPVMFWLSFVTPTISESHVVSFPCRPPPGPAGARACRLLRLRRVREPGERVPRCRTERARFPVRRHRPRHSVRRDRPAARALSAALRRHPPRLPLHRGRGAQAAQAGKLRLVLNLAGSGNHYRNPDGTFNMAVWKSRIDTYRDVDFAPYVTEGLILAHFLMDEPGALNTWGYRDLTGPAPGRDCVVALALRRYAGDDAEAPHPDDRVGSQRAGHPRCGRARPRGGPAPEPLHV